MSLFINDTDDLRTVIGVPRNFTTDALMPYLTDMEIDLLPRFLGDALTEQIIGLADPGVQEENSPEAKALRLARIAVGRLGFAKYLPFAEVTISDAGLTVPSGEGLKPAFEYQTKRIERELLDSGWKALDGLLTLVSKDPDTFPDWESSPMRAELADALFPSADLFSDFYPIQGRWLTFWALRPFIRTVEEDRGAEALGRLEAVIDDTEAGYPKIRRKLLRALALESVLMAIPHLSIQLSGANVQVNYASQYSNIDYFQPPTREQLDWVMGNLQRQADLAWLTFETALSALAPAQPDAPTSETGPIFNDKLVML